MPTAHSSDLSKRLYELASQSLAGGVGSMARGIAVGYSPYPLFVERGEGPLIYAVDGNSYLDFLLAMGPLILGHRPPEVMVAVKQALDDVGSMLGLSTAIEGEVATMIQQMVPSAEMVRFSSSGTEAVMAAIRLARAFTGKEKIVRFEGHFHGWSDMINISVKPPVAAAGLEHAPRAIPASPGIPEAFLSTVVVQPWNRPEILEKTIQDRHHEIAAIITEPLMANCGCIEPKPGYLAFLKQLAHDHGIVLIFDEVITGFRLAPGGAQECYGVTPDLSTFSKALGGGFPISAVAGRRDIMGLIADNRVPYLGTYNTNTLVMTAARATLSVLSQPGTYQRLNGLGEMLKSGLGEIFKRAGATVTMTGPGPVFQIWFAEKAPTTWRAALAASRPELSQAFHRALLRRGVLCHPSPFEHWFISTAHNEADVDRALQAAESAVSEIRHLLTSNNRNSI